MKAQRNVLPLLLFLPVLVVGIILLTWPAESAAQASASYRLLRQTLGIVTQNSNVTGSYQLRGTLGQPSATGRMNTSNYSISWGYWSPVPAAIADSNSIAGQVVDSDGDPVAGVTVSTGQGQTTTTDAAGNYLFVGLNNGSYTLTPSQNDFLFSPISRTVSVPPDGVGQNFTKLPTYSIAGRIVDDKGQPIASAIVSDGAGHTTTTDSYGYYALTDLITGTYTITPTRLGKRSCEYTYVYSPESVTISVPPDAADQNFTARYATLRGQVTDQTSGASLSGAQVRLYYTVPTCAPYVLFSGDITASSEDYVLTTYTDGGGNYQFGRLPITLLDLVQSPIYAQKMRIQVVKDGYIKYEGPIEISALDTVKNVTLARVSTPCWVPFFWQRDPQWSGHPLRGTCGSSFDTIGEGGCALSSTAMVFRYYGATAINPPVLSDRLGFSACPLNWSAAAQKSDGKASFAGFLSFDWGVLEREVAQHPVLLQLCRGDCKNRQHWVVVVSGQGNRRENYIINDPWFQDGGYKRLSDAFRDYAPASLRIFTGQSVCVSSAVAAAEASSIMLQPVPPAAPGSGDELVTQASPVISGSIWVYSMTDGVTLTVRLEAQSLAGDVTEMLLWTDSLSNTTWLPYSTFASLPASEFAYVRFRDKFGNESGVYSDTISPAGPPDGSSQLYLPMIIKE